MGVIYLGFYIYKDYTDLHYSQYYAKGYGKKTDRRARGKRAGINTPDIRGCCNTDKRHEYIADPVHHTDSIHLGYRGADLGNQKQIRATQARYRGRAGIYNI